MLINLTISLFLCCLGLLFAENINQNDRNYMRMALSLAVRPIGHTSPNPLVGCVIVNKKGDIVGRGWHHKAGSPHAEANALKNVDPAENLAECTAYVTLEPCNHFGRTPPCSQALAK
jgi:diaminohydroxyphosphoribosylaminopyrimidine deaminase / 5-amino-6-(5-phosphoribosylamino)uracil reductase